MAKLALKKKLYAFITTRKKLLVLMCIVIMLGVAVVHAYNFVYNPMSSIRYALYTPQGKGLFGGHLVVPGYKEGKFMIYGKQQGVAGFEIIGDGTEVSEEKSSGLVGCKGTGNCTMRTTPKGQPYAFMILKPQVEGYGDQHRKAIFKKGDTKITLDREHPQPMSDQDWDNLVDSFEPRTAYDMRWLSNVVLSEHFWSPV